MATGAKPLRYNALIAIRVSAIAVCGYFMFGGAHPPASAQTRDQRQVYAPVLTAPVLTVEDAGQDKNIAELDKDIAELNKHIEATDANSNRAWIATEKNAEAIAGMQGEERGVGGFLVLLSGTGLVLQVRNKKAA